MNHVLKCKPIKLKLLEQNTGETVCDCDFEIGKDFLSRTQQT